MGEAATRAQNDDFAGAGIRAHTQFRIEIGAFGLGFGHLPMAWADGDDTAWVIAACLVGNAQ